MLKTVDEYFSVDFFRGSVRERRERALQQYPGNPEQANRKRQTQSLRPVSSRSGWGKPKPVSPALLIWAMVPTLLAEGQDRVVQQSTARSPVEDGRFQQDKGHCRDTSQEELYTMWACSLCLGNLTLGDLS